MESWYRRLLAAAVLPAAGLVPLLTAKVPVTVHGAREVAGYFQALALVRTGVESYLYLTPQESFSALHLHSLLSAPLVALGYREGGRLVSLLAAVLAAVCVGLVAKRVAGDRAAILALAVLWANPAFVRHAWVFQSDTLSIALTAGAALSTLAYLDTGRDRWFTASGALLALGVTNHMWEATVAFPIVALLAADRQWRRGAGITLLTALTAGAVTVVTSLQPEGPSTLFVHGTHTVGPGVFVSPGFWLAHLDFYGGLPVPYGLVVTLLLPASALACGYWMYCTVTEGSRRGLLLAAWFASGLSIPAVLGPGYRIHYYYLWGLYAPMAVTVAVAAGPLFDALAEAVGSRGQYRTVETGERAVTATVGALVAFAVLYAVVFQAGALAGSGVPVVGDVPGERYEDSAALEAARTVRALGSSPDEVVFAGDWDADFTDSTGRVAVYSDVLFTERWLTDPGGATYRPELSTVDCSTPPAEGRVVIARHGGQTWVRDCR